MKEKFNDLIKKIKKINYKKLLIKIFKENILLWIFLVTNIINGLILRCYITNDVFKIKTSLCDLMFLLILSLIYFLIKEKKRFRYLFISSIVLTLICIINSVYYSYYDSFASVSLLATSLFIVDVGDAVVETIIEAKDFIFLWQPIFFFYINSRLVKKGIKLKHNNEKSSVIFCIALLIISLLLFVPSLTKTEWGRFSNLWNRVSVVSSFGIYTYQANDIVQSLKPKINNLFGYDKALKEVKDYYEANKKEKEENKYTNIFEGKNVITIHAESIQSFAMDLSFYDKEVTPNLNKLASEGMFFSNFYSQVGVGTSSDAEYTFATSMMPSSSGTVFVSYFNNKFVAIQDLFRQKGYNTFSMHANTGDFWNRATMHKNMGYNKFYSKEYYEIDETIGLGLSDKSFFRQAIPIIKKEKEKGKPIYTNLIMLSNHTPFSDLDLMDEYPTTMDVEIDGQVITRDYISGTTLGNYIRSVHYADQAIGEFINNLDNESLLEDTVIVIYGDHDSRINKKQFNMLYNYDPVLDRVRTEEDEGYIDYNDYEYELDTSVPFIIWTKDNKYVKEIDTPMGMIDVLPTLGNMFNVKSDYQLGTDIFSVDNGDNMVVFTDGSYLTSKIYYNGQNGDVYPINKGDIVNQEYIDNYTKKANDILEISNKIVVYNLLEKLEENKD